MKDIAMSFLSLFKLSFQKMKIVLFSIFSGTFLFSYFLNVEKKGDSFSFNIVQPDLGLGELTIVTFLLITLVTVDLILISVRSRRALDVITNPNVSEEIKKIFAEDYKNTR